MGDFKRLIVWQRARELVADVYGLTSMFPASERYGLTAQIRRSVASIPANIAESTGRQGDRDQAHLCQIAIGSSRELESHLLLASDLGFISTEDHRRAATRLDEIQRMLSRLIRHSRRKAHVSRPRS